MDKPQKPTDLLPESFGGQKENFSDDKIATGYEPDVPDILGGANLNYLIDAAGQNLKYANTLLDFINELPINKSITTDSNNKLIYTEYGIKVYNSSETFNKTDWVVGIVEATKGLYESLIDENTGNALTDETKWQKVELGGGKELEEQLNNKANVTQLDGAWIASELIAFQDITVTSTVQEFDISDYLPDSEHQYQILVNLSYGRDFTGASQVSVSLAGSIGRLSMRNDDNMEHSTGGFLVVDPTDQKLKVQTASGTQYNVTTTLLGYRKVGS